MDTVPTTPAPGWYPYPDGTQRFWDGHAWTDHVAPQVAQTRRGKPWYARWWVIALAFLGLLFGGFVVLIVVFAIAGTSPTTVDPVSSNTADYHRVTAREFALIAKDPNAHRGERIQVFGVVSQLDAATGDTSMLVDVAATPHQEPYEYDSNTMVSVADSDLLKSVVEDDQVSLYAEVVGSTSYDTQIGGNTTVLHLNAGVVVVR